MLANTTCIYIQAHYKTPILRVRAVHSPIKSRVFPLQALSLFNCDIPSPGQILSKIEMKNVASSIVKGTIYFDLIKGALVGPRCIIL